MTLPIRIAETTLHCRVDGPRDGPTLVFSNSLGTDFRTWEWVLPLLPPELRIVRYDKRGHGLSDCPDGPWSIEDQVGDLAGLLDALDVSGAVVVGLSVGGLIAQGLAATRPDLVSALVLCDTGAKIGTDEMWNARIAAVEEGGIEAIAEGVLERWFTRSFRETGTSYPIWRNMLLRTPKAGYLRTAAAIRDCDYRQATAGLTLPCLAICGAEDGATPPDLVRETAALIDGSRFELIEDAGHIPCVEQPRAFAELVSGFLAEIDHVGPGG